MISCRILFDARGLTVPPNVISNKISEFGESYTDATRDIIQGSRVLDKDGEVFIKCASRILSNFKMTRRGIFHDNLEDTLYECWSLIGTNLVELNTSIRRSGFSRDRYLLELSDTKREEIISEIWLMTKALLPLTMTKLSYGLVGASKILFSVLPEIVLPTDNTQWKQLFKTVDLGDVLRFMVFDIQQWERITGSKLNDLDLSRRLTTLPSVYNVMAMAARP